MKIYFLILTIFICLNIKAQEDNSNEYKKRVLESTEIEILSSYYKQTGNNASVTGGIGKEELTDITPTIVVNIPLSDDEVLTGEIGISTYSSASSSNLDPFDKSSNNNNPNNLIGSPWVTSSGASYKDTWISLNATYSHSSDDRNKIWNTNISFAKEYDYTSIGIGGGYSLLFNEKNTELGFNVNLYFDKWSPKYPIELETFLDENGDLNSGLFSNINIYNASGFTTIKTENTWQPISGFSLIDDEKRNTFSMSVSFTQILSKKVQLGLFLDFVLQKGWLANPMQRVYFSDRPNYFIGNNSSIPNYTSPTNTDVFMLADDIERLPDKRFKIPLGMRLNYYVNEIFTIRTYYRYYYDDWGISAHTASIEIPIKLGDKFVVYPLYRFYKQSEADYFAAFDMHLSTSQYYTSDYDLSDFTSHKYGIGIRYTDIFTKFHISKFGLKSIDFRYNRYERNTELNANFFAIGFKFSMD